MARKPNPEVTTEIEDAQVPEGTFANIPLPRDEENIPPVTGDDQLAVGRPKRSAPHSANRVDSRPEVPAHQQSMKQIIDEFMAKISGHPDCNILTSQFGGKPSEQASFRGTPRQNQRVVELRFVWRDTPVEVADQLVQTPKSPYEPGGKFYDMIDRKDKQQIPEPPNPTPFAYDHMVHKKEPVTA